MARRTLTWTQWLKKIAGVSTPDDLGDLGGVPVDDVATKLGVTRQSVHQMIDTDKLDAIVILTKRGNTAAVIITQASLDYYLAHRRPYGSTERFVLTADNT
jgi:predicted transcriptional regulator